MALLGHIYLGCIEKQCLLQAGLAERRQSGCRLAKQQAAHAIKSIVMCSRLHLTDCHQQAVL